jgi:hypothetical protein
MDAAADITRRIPRMIQIVMNVADVDGGTVRESR